MSATDPDLAATVRGLSRRVAALRFGAPAAHVYDPTGYAWPVLEGYLDRWGAARGRVLFLGMNPGPWGMMQTGVPFGDPAFVRDWMGLRGEVGRPRREHARVPVRGLASPRKEGSGQRLWGWARDRFGTADRFFDGAFVWNYCPLGFLDDGGRNVVPEKLAAAPRDALLAACDDALGAIVRALAPRALVGVGVFAEARLRAVAPAHPELHRLLHPSPASPLANKGWAPAADALADRLAM